MNQRGVTLIEMLIALVISSIAMMALAVPFVAERAMALSGQAQTEAQRDAEMVMRAIARVARESDKYRFPPVNPASPPPPSGTTDDEVGFISWSGGGCFKGGPAFNNKLLMFDSSCVGVGGIATAELIDGNRSKVENFTVTSIIPDKLVRIRLEVTHRPRVIPGNPERERVENEVLETEIFLRNEI